MSWGWKTNENDSAYTVKWLYAASEIPKSDGSGNFAANTLHAGCDIDVHKYALKNVTLKDWGFDGGSITDSFSGIYITAVNSDGSFDYRRFGLTFKSGILQSAYW